MSNEFSIAGLIPEPLIFRDEDGTRYPARTTLMFGPIDMAVYERLQKEYVAAAAILMDVVSNPKKRDHAARAVEQVIDEMVTTIVPDLPQHRLAAIPFGFKAQFIAWWKDQVKGPEAGKAQGEVQIPAQPSPA